MLLARTTLRQRGGARESESTSSPALGAGMAEMKH